MGTQNGTQTAEAPVRRFLSAEQIEDVVRQLKDVVSARAVLDTLGRVEELHVLVNPRRAPKQIARDIESALIAHLGLTIDYKKISIAQVQGRAALGNGAAGGRGRLLFQDVAMTVSGAKAEARVHLNRDDTLYTGSAIGHASSHNQLRLIATATIRAVENGDDHDGTMAVEDVSAPVSLAGRQAIVVLVSAITTPKGEDLMTGSALIRHDPWKAVVNATLDAVNRRISLSLSDSEF